MAQAITLAGSAIKQPKDFRIGSFTLTKAGRTADGLMKIDRIAGKKKFYFEYEALRGDDLDTIKDIIEGTTMFFTLTYYDNDVAKSATVYAGALEKTQFRTDGKWVWKEISFDLIQQ